MKTILLVEDDEDNRDLVEFTLMRSKLNAKIVMAENGKVALNCISKQVPDLILMDMQMPVMDGFTATTIIKQDPQLKSIPIIAFTALAGFEDIERSKKLGCVEHVIKPIDPEKLITTIKKYII